MAGRLLNFSKVGGGGLSPEIVVNVDTGSTVTAGKGAITVSATSVSGKCTLVIPTYGTWVVTATLGGNSATQNIIVDTLKQYEITLTYIYLPVGGRIFYIHNDNGATYRFFDSSYNEITDITVAGLANAVYYSVTGTHSADKFYVYDSTTGLVSDKEWGARGTSVGVTSDGIGLGKTNSATCLATSACFTPYTEGDTTIWKWLRDDINANSVGGCNDWFIGSKAEQDQLRSSELVDWYSINSIWSSVEKYSTGSWYWGYSSGAWYDYYKNNTHCAVAFRSF